MANSQGTRSYKLYDLSNKPSPMETLYPQQPVVQDYNTEHILKKGEAYQSKSILRFACLFLITLLTFSNSLNAQYCNPNVPTFTVNLTGNPNGSWISPVVSRADNCCGSLPPDNCVQFVVTLDPSSQGIVFDIFSGSVPPGALYYQINCNPPTPVGQPICLVGVGPHYITFCKPGNNSNEYIISAIPSPGVGPNTMVNSGCSDTIYCMGLDEPTITWNSIYPGAPGTFNSLLSCSVGCDTTIVTGQPNSPMYVDFLVCGQTYGGCAQSPYCDTVRVYLNQALVASIFPQNPVICFGSPGIWITGSATGGTPQYSYLWNTGATTQSIFVGPGTYTVAVSDTTGCPSAMATITVTAFTAPITANAGPNQSVCTTSLPIQLSGVVTGTSTGIWSGGAGTYSPSNTSLNATYTPTTNEINAGFVTLILTNTGNGPCPPDADTITIQLNSFQANVTMVPTNVSCFGANNGTAAINATGGNPPFSYSWNTVPVQTTSTATGLSPGTYSVLITDVNGCTSTATVSITQPPVLSLTTSGFSANCYNACNGQATVIPSGGNGNFSFLWSPSGGTGPAASGLCAGTYTIIVTDQNGCTQSDTAIVAQPTQLAITPPNVTNVSCFSGCNGSASITVSGGNGPYSYLWNTTPAQTTANAVNVCAGNYTVVVTDANGCTSTASASVTQPQPLTFTIMPPPATLCIGQSITLTSTVSGGTAPYTYNWSSGNPTVSPTTTTTYTLTVTDANGCTTTAQTVTVSVYPSLNVTAQGPQIHCMGSTSTLSATGAGGNGGPYTYSWSPGNLNGQTVTVTPTATTTYTVTVSDNCTNPVTSTTITLVVSPLPVVAYTSDVDHGCSALCVQFTNSSSNYSSSLWNFGDNTTSTQTNPQHCYNTPGNYSVTLTVTNSQGCTNSLTTPSMITVYNTPTASFTLGPQPTTLLDPEICFTDHSTSDVVTWYWNFDDPNDQTGSTMQNNCHTYSDTGTYCPTLIVHNVHGCWSTATNCLRIQPYFTLYVPNAFTPDGDGLNDEFIPQGSTIDESSYELLIFDRWGKGIFKSTAWGKGWDGKVTGGSQVVPIGVYVWKIKVRDYTGAPHILTGHVSVIK